MLMKWIFVVGGNMALVKEIGSTLLLPQYKNVTYSEMQKQDTNWVNEFINRNCLITMETPKNNEY
jgi:hypothetical protein